MIMIEQGFPFLLKPGKFTSIVGCKRFVRVWWLFWAVTWFDGDLKEYGDAHRNDRTIWINT